MENRKGQTKAYAAAILNAAIIGFSFLFTKLALEHASPMDTLTYRFAVSFAVMSIPVALGRIKLAYRDKPVYKALLLAGFYPLGFFTLQTFGLQHASSAEGGILYAFTPVLTMLLATIFLKETTSVFQKGSIFVSVFGVVFIFVMKGSGIDLTNMTGIFLLFMSCVSFAGYSVLAWSLLKTFSPAEISYLMLGIGFFAFLTFSLIDHAVSGTLNHLVASMASSEFIASIFYLGVMSTLITALTANYALSRIEAFKMSVFSNLSTVVSIAAGAVILEETVAVHHVIGSLLIIAGVTGANMTRHKKMKERKMKHDIQQTDRLFQRRQ